MIDRQLHKKLELKYNLILCQNNLPQYIKKVGNGILVG